MLRCWRGVGGRCWRLVTLPGPRGLSHTGAVRQWSRVTRALRRCWHSVGDARGRVISGWYLRQCVMQCESCRSSQATPHTTLTVEHRPRAWSANSPQICTYVIRITNEDAAAAQKWHGDLANRNLHHHLEFFNHYDSRLVVGHHSGGGLRPLRLWDGDVRDVRVLADVWHARHGAARPI